MDEDIQPAENIDVPADVTESPAVEVEEAPSETPVEQPQEQPKARNNAPSRLREVLGDKKQLKAENEQLRQMLEQQSQMQVPDKLSEDQYRALATDAQYAAIKVQDLERRLAFKDFSQEVDAIEQKYPELDPKSDSFNEKLANALTEAYSEGYIVKDSNGLFVSTKKSLSDFTAGMIEAYRTAETRGATKTQEALAKQASEAVVTADNTNDSDTTAFKDLSIAEMEKKLGVVRN